MIYGQDEPMLFPVADLYDSGMMQMYTNALKQQYDEGRKDYENFVSQYGDFTSPMAADVEYWDNNTVKPVQDMMNYFYQNGIDPIRNPEALAMIRQQMRKVPYGELAKRRQSAKNAEQYLKNRATLQAQGLWNEDMEKWALGGKTLESWDSSDGMWTRTSPIQYKSMDDIIEPIVSKLDPTFDAELTRQKNDGFDYSTVSRDRIRQTIDDNMVDLIAGDSAGGYYYQKALEASGNDPVVAREILKDWYTNRASNHVKITREQNPYKLDEYRTRNDIKAHTANAATDAYYNMLPYADTDGDGKISKDERSQYAKALQAGKNRGKKDERNIFRDAEADTMKDQAYLPKNTANAKIAPMNNKIQFMQDQKSKQFVYLIPGDEVSNVMYTEYTTSHEGRTYRYAGHSGDAFDKSKQYIFIPNGGLRHKRINGVDRYFIGGTLREKGSSKPYGYNNRAPITYEMEVKENLYNYGEKQ